MIEINDLIDNYKPERYISVLYQQALRLTNTSLQRLRVNNLYCNFMERYAYNHKEEIEGMVTFGGKNEYLEREARTAYRYLQRALYNQNKINEESERILKNSNCVIELQNA